MDISGQSFDLVESVFVSILMIVCRIVQLNYSRHSFASNATLIPESRVGFVEHDLVAVVPYYWDVDEAAVLQAFQTTFAWRYVCVVHVTSDGAPNPLAPLSSYL